MKFLIIIIVLILNNLFINSLEVHIIKYKNLLCKNDPIYIVATTNCSKIGFFQKGASNSLGITQVNSIQDCNIDKKITKFVNTKQCYLNQDGTSYQYIINDYDTPRAVDTYCNEFTLFDCNNYYVNSFRNNSCSKHFNNTNDDLIINYNNTSTDQQQQQDENSIIYKRKECIGDIINIYECSSKNCEDSSKCILKQSYSSNYTVCPNVFESLKVFSFLGSTKSTNENSSDDIYLNTSIDSFDDDDEDSSSIKLLPNLNLNYLIFTIFIYYYYYYYYF